jgi:hypothetical protein
MVGRWCVVSDLSVVVIEVLICGMVVMIDEAVEIEDDADVIDVIIIIVVDVSVVCMIIGGADVVITLVEGFFVIVVVCTDSKQIQNCDMAAVVFNSMLSSESLVLCFRFY